MFFKKSVKLVADETWETTDCLNHSGMIQDVFRFDTIKKIRLLVYFLDYRNPTS